MSPGYSDANTAALYDLLNPWGPSDDYYLGHVLAADAVLDVGCGTGMLLRTARERGHPGRLTGVDPDRAALDRARRRTDVEWRAGTAADLDRRAEFDLVVLASNVFQVFVTDTELRTALAAIRDALHTGGRLVFGTRNPPDRAWERWHPGNATELTDAAGRALRVIHQVESVVDGVVTFGETVSTQAGGRLRTDRTRLRFTPAAELDTFLTEAGFTVENRWGDWDRGPFTPAAGNIVTEAVAA